MTLTQTTMNWFSFPSDGSKTGFNSAHRSAVEPDCNFYENEGLRDAHF